MQHSNGQAPQRVRTEESTRASQASSAGSRPGRTAPAPVSTDAGLPARSAEPSGASPAQALVRTASATTKPASNPEPLRRVEQHAPVSAFTPRRSMSIQRRLGVVLLFIAIFVLPRAARAQDVSGTWIIDYP